MSILFYMILILKLGLKYQVSNMTRIKILAIQLACFIVFRHNCRCFIFLMKRFWFRASSQRNNGISTVNCMFTLWITGNFPVKMLQKLMRVETLKVCTAPTVKYTKCYMPGFYHD